MDTMIEFKMDLLITIMDPSVASASSISNYVMESARKLCELNGEEFDGRVINTVLQTYGFCNFTTDFISIGINGKCYNITIDTPLYLPVILAERFKNGKSNILKIPVLLNDNDTVFVVDGIMVATINII